MTDEHTAYVTNPDAIGDPDETPVIQLPPGMAAMLLAGRCPDCGLVNRTHEDDCPAVTR